ncbi:MAG TPA: hypothetical protein V6C58_14300 [Allocoleopsis sp.]
MSLRNFEIKEVSILSGSTRAKPMKVFPGNFKSKTHKRAAVKAFNAVCKRNKRRKNCEMKITVGEKGKDSPLRSYKISRIYDPREIEIGGKTVTFKYKTSVYSV